MEAEQRAAPRQLGQGKKSRRRYLLRTVYGYYNTQTQRLIIIKHKLNNIIQHKHEKELLDHMRCAASHLKLWWNFNGADPVPHSQLQFSTVTPQGDGCVWSIRILHITSLYSSSITYGLFCLIATSRPNFQASGFWYWIRMPTEMFQTHLRIKRMLCSLPCFFLYPITLPPSCFLSWNPPQCTHVYALYSHIYQVFKDSHIISSLF